VAFPIALPLAAYQAKAMRVVSWAKPNRESCVSYTQLAAVLGQEEPSQSYLTAVGERRPLVLLVEAARRLPQLLAELA